MEDISIFKLTEMFNWSTTKLFSLIISEIMHF